ncbi:MAG TPA: hypothetical protein VEL50_02840 [Gemmatimonadales bacterium]|nr:hypothetical protein [Gemmatimonadales bacterium]
MPPQLIDDFAPQWQFREIHRIGVLAPPEVALRAIREVTAREIRLFRLLTWVRRLGIPGRESILNPPPDQPIIDVALRTGFLLLASSPPDPLSASRRGGTFGEIVLGSTVVMPHGAAPPTNPDEFLALRSPGWAKAVMNFRVDHTTLALCVVSTETRVWTSDPRTQRNFALYWWTIRLGSGLIRRMWLRAIRRRAERIGS